MFLRIFLISICLYFISCSSTQPLTTEESSSPTAMEKSQNLAKLRLIDYLRNQPGIQIRGSGNFYKILIRGHKSFQGADDPLYVLDGVPIGRDYKTAATTVDVTQIDKVKVIPPPRAGRYGNRGQNGVIEITTKRTIE